MLKRIGMSLFPVILQPAVIEGRRYQTVNTQLSTEEIQASSAIQATVDSESSKEADDSIGSSASVVQKLTNSSKETLSDDFKGEGLVERNLTDRLKFECQFWDLHKDGSVAKGSVKSQLSDLTQGGVKTAFREVTKRTAVPRKDAKDQVLPDDAVYVAYAYPEGDSFGSFLYYNEQGKLTYIVKLEKFAGRNDYQSNLKAIGKDEPDCDLKDFNFGFQDVKRFCWANHCKKKNGKKLDRHSSYCLVFEKNDGTYWSFYRDAKVFESTWRRWMKDRSHTWRKWSLYYAKNSEATSQSIVVSIAVTLYLFFS